MGIIDELSRLNQLRESGALTELEFEHAKAIALQESANLPEISHASVAQAQDAKVDTRLQIMEAENHLLKIEQAWQRERETYLVSGPHGTKIEPASSGCGISVGLALIGGVCVVVGAVGQASSSPNVGMATPFLVVVVVVGVLMILIAPFEALKANRKAKEFRYARDDYEQRRADAEANLAEITKAT